MILIGWERKNDAMLEGCTNVIPLPSTSSIEMLAEYYSLADVFVLPSLAENYATTALESMACGTPVVGFEVGGIPEQLSGGRGIVVKPGDQQAFTAAVEKVLEGGGTLLGRECLAEEIRRENSTEKMTEAYLEIYGRLIRGDL